MSKRPVLPTHPDTFEEAKPWVLTPKRVQELAVQILLAAPKGTAHKDFHSAIAQLYRETKASVPSRIAVLEAAAAQANNAETIKYLREYAQGLREKRIPYQAPLKPALKKETTASNKSVTIDDSKNSETLIANRKALRKAGVDIDPQEVAPYKTEDMLADLRPAMTETGLIAAAQARSNLEPSLVQRGQQRVRLMNELLSEPAASRAQVKQRTKMLVKSEELADTLRKKLGYFLDRRTQADPENVSNFDANIAAIKSAIEELDSTTARLRAQLKMPPK